MKQLDPNRYRRVAENRRARFDYFIEENIEAGLVLVGTEVKSLRQGRASITEAFAMEQSGELFLMNAGIEAYTEGNRFNHEPRRPRKLLLSKRQLGRLFGLIRQKGYTLIPLSIYFNSRGIAKVDLGLARGKRQVDKRESIKEKDWKRTKARLLRSRTYTQNE